MTLKTILFFLFVVYFSFLTAAASDKCDSRFGESFLRTLTMIFVVLLFLVLFKGV